MLLWTKQKNFTHICVLCQLAGLLRLQNTSTKSRRKVHVQEKVSRGGMSSRGEIARMFRLHTTALETDAEDMMPPCNGSCRLLQSNAKERNFARFMFSGRPVLTLRRTLFTTHLHAASPNSSHPYFAAARRWIRRCTTSELRTRELGFKFLPIS